MKLKISIGNPDTEEWDQTIETSLIPYVEIFKAKYPNLSPPSFEGQFGLENFEVDEALIKGISFSVTYSSAQNHVNLIAMQNGQSISQAHGQAFNEHGSGLLLIFTVPGKNYPVSISLVK